MKLIHYLKQKLTLVLHHVWEFFIFPPQRNPFDTAVRSTELFNMPEDDSPKVPMYRPYYTSASTQLHTPSHPSIELIGLCLLISKDVDATRADKAATLFFSKTNKLSPLQLNLEAMATQCDWLGTDLLQSSPSEQFSVYAVPLHKAVPFTEEKYTRKHFKAFRKAWSAVEDNLDFLPACDIEILPMIAKK